CAQVRDDDELGSELGMVHPGHDIVVGRGVHSQEAPIVLRGADELTGARVAPARVDAEFARAERWGDERRCERDRRRPLHLLGGCVDLADPAVDEGGGGGGRGDTDHAPGYETVNTRERGFADGAAQVPDYRGAAAGVI